MLRRVTRTLRISLFAAGLALLLWLAFSQRYLGYLYFSSSAGTAHFMSYKATLHVFTWNQPYSRNFALGFVNGQAYSQSGGIGFEHNGDWTTHFVWDQWPSGSRIVIPLWQLCVLLLAVPLVPFIPRKLLFVRRRKEPRGFPVELANDAPPAPGPEGTTSAEHEQGR